MEKRIFMASKNGHCVGINYDESTDTPTSFAYTFEGAEEDNTALRALIDVMKNENVENYDNVAQIFVNKSLYEFIVFGGYKFWLKTGKKLNGLKIQEDILQLYREFNELYKEKGDNFIIKDIFTCPISDKVKNDDNLLAKVSIWSQRNDAYAEWCWTEVNKKVVKSVQNKIRGVI